MGAQQQTDLRFGEHGSTRSTNAYGQSIDTDQSTQWPIGHASDQLDANSFRSMLAQEFRPSETGTITHTYLKLQLQSDTSTNGDGTTLTTGTGDPSQPGGVTAYKQAYVSIWITQHGKYGQYVCSVFGGLPSSAAVSATPTTMGPSLSLACSVLSVTPTSASMVAAATEVRALWLKP